MKTNITIEVIYLDEFTQYNFKLNEKVIKVVKMSNFHTPQHNLCAGRDRLENAILEIEDEFEQDEVSFDYVYYKNKTAYLKNESFDPSKT